MGQMRGKRIATKAIESMAGQRKDMNNFRCFDGVSYDYCVTN